VRHLWSWMKAWYDPGVKRPSWGTRLERRLAARCALCGQARHTSSEHVRLPQAELRKRDMAMK
jgi:hypothetical protein